MAVVRLPSMSMRTSSVTVVSWPARPRASNVRTVRVMFFRLAAAHTRCPWPKQKPSHPLGGVISRLVAVSVVHEAPEKPASHTH